MSVKAWVWLALGAAALLTVSNTLYVVGQTEQALVLEFGKPVAVRQEPGLKAKLPFVQNVEYFEKRLLDFTVDSEEFNAADQKRLIVDAFVRYRITDPLRFKQTMRDERTLHSHLKENLDSVLREVFSGVTLREAISDQRAALMHDAKTTLNARVSKGVDGKGGFGIEIADVRIMRADLPPTNSEGIYRRMQTERDRMAKDFRAKGEEEAQKIRSTADKDRTVLIAEARKKAETIRGEGDGLATKIFADAFGRDEEFFAFYRSMQAYRKTLSNTDTTLILSPDSDFLRFLGKGPGR